MRRTLPAIAVILGMTSTAHAEECAAGSTCVPTEDMATIRQVLKDKHCEQTTKPEFKADPINIIIDKDGRIYGSGSDPKPWTLHMKWCSYEIDAAGQVQLLAAMRQEPDYGFRFRPKASMGLLVVEAFKRNPWTEAIDVGVLVEPFFYHSLNLNIAVGFRSFGAGVGVDLTRNMGFYLGYAAAFSGLRSNPYAGFYFAFW